MAFTQTVKLPKKTLCIQTDGTYLFCGCSDGKLWQITIAIPVVTKVVLAIINGEPLCMVTDATYLYIGTNKGILVRVTISDGTQSVLQKVDSAIISIHITGSTLYMGMADGRIMKKT